MKIYFPLRYEPLTVDEVQEIIDEKKRAEEFWKQFRNDSSSNKLY